MLKKKRCQNVNLLHNCIMDNQEKTNEELQTELMELLQENNSLKKLLNNCAAELNIAKKELAFQYQEIEKQTAELKRSKLFLEEAGLLVRIGGWEIDLMKNELFWSDMTYQIHEVDPGYKPTIKSAINFYAPEAIPVISALVNQAIEEGKSFDVDLPLITAKQNRIWVRAIGRAYRVNGKIVKIRGVFQNITEKKQVESDLQQSKRELSTLMNNLPGMVYSCLNDQVWTMKFVSDGSYELTEFSPEELIGNKITSFDKIIHPDDRKMVWDTVQDVLRNRANYTLEYRIITKSGIVKYVWERGQGIYSSDGTLHHLEGFITDINERRSAAILIQNERLLLRTVIDNIPDSIYVKDLNCRKTLVNPTELRYAGVRTESEIIGKNDFDLYPKEVAEKFFADDQSVLSGLPVINREEFIPDENQQKRWLLTSKMPLFDMDHKIIGLLGIGRDITEIEHTKVELIKAKEKAEESDRLKSAFLANMSHEIRTPMNGILGFADLLKEPKLSTAEQKEYISLIEKSGVRMLNIINDIIDISKIESGQMKVNIKESTINEQIEYIYEFFKPEVEAKGMQILYKNALLSKESIIKTDREKVFAILTNLVKNAIKYSDKGTIEFGYLRKGEYLEFFVKDKGIGISKDRQGAIFERFIQADYGDKRAYQGAGLGLTISKGYVEMLGGKIWVDSEEGKGSMFYFTLPYITTSNEKIVSKNVIKSYYPDRLNNKLKILIAEDDFFSEKLISLMLKKIGKEFLRARTGIDAVKGLLNNPDIDLVLMDIQMPEMNGYEATRQIREFNKDVIIIAQTAFGLSGDREKAIEAGCNEYLAKPINKDELFALIQHYF